MIFFKRQFLVSFIFSCLIFLFHHFHLVIKIYSLTFSVGHESRCGLAECSDFGALKQECYQGVGRCCSHLLWKNLLPLSVI